MANIKISFQHDSMECGIACIQMLCSFYGKEVNSEYLANYCFATTEGISLLGISQAAEQLGFETFGGKLDVDELCHVPLPCILHWNQNHFVVLHKIKRKRRGIKFYVADPGKGMLSYSDKDLREHWISTKVGKKNCGIALLLKPTEKFYFFVDSEYKGESHSMRFLTGYAKQYKVQFLRVFLCLLIASGLQLLLPFLTQAIVDVGIKNQDIGFVWLVLLGQLMLTVSRTGVDFVRRRLLLKVSMQVSIAMVNDFFKKLLLLPMSFFDTKLMGDIMQRMSDHNRLNTFLTQRMLSTVFSLITFAVFGFVLWWYNAMVFTIFLVGSLLYGAWLYTFLDRRKVLDYELFEYQSKNNSKTYEFITSMQEIKLQHCEQRRRDEWEDVQHSLFEVQMKSLKLQQTQEAGSIFINEMKNIIITVVAATAVIQGDMTLGMMLAVQYIIGQLNSPVEQLMQLFYSVQDVKISLERINEIHNAKNENGDMGLKTVLADDAEGIHLDNISFKYNPHALTKTINSIDITIPQGKVTAIVGASGSGKTTLIKLMLGYYPVSDGRITIGGTDITQIDKKWWRSQCGVVMQDGVIFSESIERNIAVSDGEVDKEKLIHAAEMACIYDYIKNLPLSFNTKIGRDGVGLSQGQRQRILIARAIYKDPDFILLDEATNSLDASNERRITENLDEFYHGKTVIIVAHRLSTVRNADQIIVLADGHVAEQGTHDSLVAAKGAYYNLVKNQLELGG